MTAEREEHLRFKLDRDTIEALEERKIYLSLRPGKAFERVGQVVGVSQGARTEPFVTFVSNNILEAGFASYVGSSLERGVVVGRYCSIAAGVKVMGGGTRWTG